jgi:hypothetical protein
MTGILISPRHNFRHGVVGGLKLINPQSGLAFDLEGADAQALTLPPAPRIDGPENASEMGELYWMALLRDVSFIDSVPSWMRSKSSGLPLFIARNRPR